jgi:hypothetical protein
MPSLQNDGRLVYIHIHNDGSLQVWNLFFIYNYHFGVLIREQGIAMGDSKNAPKLRSGVNNANANAQSTRLS